jgi:hypothetical protein
MVTMMKDIREMKHFRKWAEDKSPFLATMALTIAGFSQDCIELFESVRTGKRIEGDIPLPSLKRWLRLYRNPNRIGKVLLNALRNINDDTAKGVAIIEGLLNGAKQLQKMTGEQFKAEWEKMLPDERKEIFEAGHKTLEGYKEYLIHDFIGEANEDEAKEFKKNLTKPEFIFLIRVLVPSFSLYGTYPVDLLRKAQQGDDDALEKLIRLDKSIIFDPKISEIIHQAQAMKKQERMSMIKKAFSSPPRVKTDMKMIKCHLGGLISLFSMMIGQKITAAEISLLYDALARDMGIDEFDPDLNDPDNLVYNEAFEKAIQRARAMWHIILIPDKK